LADKTRRVNSNPASPKSLLRLLAYPLAVVLLACLISPPLYWVGNFLSGAGILPIVEGFPFHRYFSRSVQISALLLLWPAFRWVGIRSLSVLGIDKNPRWKRDLAVGFVLAFLPVLALGAGYFFSGVYEFRADWEGAKFLRVAATACAVSVVEEFLFRCVFLGLCLMAMGQVAAVGFSAAFFAVVHFLKTAKQPLDSPVTWWSGFEQLPLLFSSAPPWPLLGWGFVSLVLAGVLLAVATICTRSLFLAIGLHAGWILGQQGIQILGKFGIKPSDRLLPWVGENVVSGAVPTGLLPLVVLGITGVLIFWFLRYARCDGKNP
jgi:membrane protease YdiL (CAAX protease family)